MKLRDGLILLFVGFGLWFVVTELRRDGLVEHVKKCARLVADREPYPTLNLSKRAGEYYCAKVIEGIRIPY